MAERREGKHLWVGAQLKQLTKISKIPYNTNFYFFKFMQIAYFNMKYGCLQRYLRE